MRNSETRLLVFVLVLWSAMTPRPARCGTDDTAAAVHLQIWGEKIKGSNGRQQIRMHWRCDRHDVASYEIEAKIQTTDDDPSNFALLYIAPGGPQGEYIETNLSPGALYTFRIRADFDDGTVSDYQ